MQPHFSVLLKVDPFEGIRLFKMGEDVTGAHTLIWIEFKHTLKNVPNVSWNINTR
jgi:hypothetical protein